jgi:hypothetical protein
MYKIMTIEKFKEIFVNTFNNYNWKVELKDGKIEDHCSMKLNTLTHHAGDDFRLKIITKGEDFNTKSDSMKDLMEEIYMFMGTNPNEYKVEVGITISIKKV